MTLYTHIEQRFGKTVRPEDDLFETLQIDSLQALDLLTDLEEVFDIEIPDYELQEIRTFAQLGACIEARL